MMHLIYLVYKIIKEIKNPNDTHKYTAKACIKEINKKIQKDNVKLLFGGKEVEMNMYHFSLFTTYFGIKENERNDRSGTECRTDENEERSVQSQIPARYRTA